MIHMTFVSVGSLRRKTCLMLKQTHVVRNIEGRHYYNSKPQVPVSVYYSV